MQHPCRQLRRFPNDGSLSDVQGSHLAAEWTDSPSDKYVLSKKDSSKVHTPFNVTFRSQVEQSELLYEVVMQKENNRIPYVIVFVACRIY